MRRIINLTLLVSMMFLSSCYHKELHYSYIPSYGGVTDGSGYVYLAQAREFQMPKGISAFPDGGISKDVRSLFGLFKTDTITNSTILVTKLGSVVGWPSRYATRISKSGSYIAFGIVNLSKPDSICGVYLFDTKRNELIKYSGQGSLPSLSPEGSRMAHSIANRLVIEDFLTKTPLFSYVLNFNPVFVTWKSEQEILIFLSEPFRVKLLNLSTGKTTDTDFKYLTNYAQEIDISQISKLIKEESRLAKETLDKYY